ncbi:MAG: HAD-IC family P-type ATPase [Chitinivibrionales bacterium]|nr:HAD-IC family P-type ATPase [Chitinivibrionales bacterium]
MPSASSERTRPVADRPWHTLTPEEVLEELSVSREGLSHDEAQRRLEQFGSNALPRKGAPSVAAVFLRQLKSPLIYVLLVAGVISLLIGELYDAVFIFVVVLLNTVIGTFQEYRSEQSAAALQEYLKSQARVRREDDELMIDADQVVPGDIVLLESGNRIPADMRFIRARKLTVDESPLTGESTAVDKTTETLGDEQLEVGDQENMGFAGSTVMSGRAEGVVTATGMDTMLGSISKEVVLTEQTKPPLVLRMEQFTQRLSYVVLGAVLVLAGVSFLRGTPLAEVFFMAVALAVSAIPEGLPVSMTVALAIGVNRMAGRHVIVRRLPAVEGLGSCTYIASDKTGTLTVNMQTARRILLPGTDGFRALEVSGEGYAGEGDIRGEGEREARQSDRERAVALARAAVVCNEGTLVRRDGDWRAEGDAIDIALLALGYKAHVSPGHVRAQTEETADIPFESERKYAAVFYTEDGTARVAVKGATEKLLTMCDSIVTENGARPIDAETVHDESERLAAAGYRVLAVAQATLDRPIHGGESLESKLPRLSLLGLVGFIDPLRPEVKDAVATARSAGVKVAMVTGDHPRTALAIARELGIADRADEVVSGRELAGGEGIDIAALERKVQTARVFARVSPTNKVRIVEELRRQGHFVAVTGDGVNDAPALRKANIGVAMGSGTDVTKDTGSIIVTDDNFASIVAGIGEGRRAYQNLRKVIYLLVSTGAAEVILFTLALLFDRPLPLMPAQILWLNLVTNGIQDKTLAFEAGEHMLMQRPPRDPEEGIFNPLMITETVVTASVMAGVGFAAWLWMLDAGLAPAQARNYLLLLMVLFENYHVLNCRSESESAFRIPLRNNPILVLGVVAALGIHIASFYIPFLQRVLGTEPVTPSRFFILLALASTVLIASEIFKLIYRRRTRRESQGAQAA